MTYLDSGVRALVASLALHLVLHSNQPGVADLHVPGADVAGVLEVCRLTDHRPVDPPPLLPLSLPLRKTNTM